MNPRIFVSCVSDEFRTVRDKVAEVIRFLSCEPVTMADWSMGQGELLGWLRDQIDSCEGFIQIAGIAYGGEPPNHPTDFLDLPVGLSRYSYTQFEYFYAATCEKKIWIIQPGDACTRDIPIDKLDLPKSATGLPDSSIDGALEYQMLRRDLQTAYVRVLADRNLIRHQPTDDKDIQLLIHSLRDNAAELRQKFSSWQSFVSDHIGQLSKKSSRLLRVVVTAVILALILASGMWWTITHQSKKTQESLRVLKTTLTDPVVLKRKLEIQIREEADKQIADLKKRDAKWQDVAELESQRDRQIRHLDDLIDTIGKTLGPEADPVYQEAVRILENQNQGLNEAIRYLEFKRPILLKEAEAIGDDIEEAQLRQESKLQPMMLQADFLKTQLRHDEAISLLTEIANVAPHWWDPVKELGSLHTELARWAQAKEFLQKALILAKDPEETATSKHQLGVLLQAIGDVDRAKDLLEQVFEHDKSTYGNWHPHTLPTANNLAVVLAKVGKIEEAKLLFASNLEASKTIQNDREAGMACHGMAEMLRLQRQLAEAEKFAKRALDYFSSVNNPYSAGKASALNELGLISFGMSRLDDAEHYFRSAYEIDVEIYHPQHPRVGVDLTNIGTVLMRKGRLDEAEEFVERAFEIMRQSFGPRIDELSSARNRLAQILQRRGDFKRAEELFRTALRDAEANFGPSSPLVARQCNNLAELIREMTDRETHDPKGFVEAETLYERSLAIEVETSGEGSNSVAGTLNNLALCQLQAGHLSKAEKSGLLAASIYKKNGHEELPVAYNFTTLGVICSRRKQYKKAAEYHRQGSLIMARDYLESGYKDAHFANVLIPYFVTLVKVGLSGEKANEALMEVGTQVGWKPETWQEVIYQLAGLSSTNAKKSKAEELDESGMSEYEKGENARALDLWNASLKAYRSEAEDHTADINRVRLNIAACRVNLDDLATAKRDLLALINDTEAANSEKSIAARARYHLARALLALGEKQAAILRLRESLQIYKTMPDETPKSYADQARALLKQAESEVGEGSRASDL